MIVRASVRFKVIASLAVALAACGTSETGGITARLVFDDGLGTRKGLRAAALPLEVEKLVIEALAKDGTVLGVTSLSRTPDTTFGELPLDPAGGKWRIERVKAGKERMLRARAFLGVIGRPADDRALVFEGELTGIEVRASQVTDAGALVLQRVRTVRIPALDTEAPIPPGPVTLEVVPSGEALIVRFPRPPDADLAGHLVAYTTEPVLTATIARGADLTGRSEIVPGLPIAAILGPDMLETVITGLSDRTPTRVLVYAFDADVANLPLNYSVATEALAVPDDTVPPSIAQALTVTSTGGDVIQVEFAAPGEDADEGMAARFEVRASTSTADLLDAGRFATRAFIEPPLPALPGVLVRTTARRSALGFTGRFYVGVRAVDASGNTGDVAYAEAREPTPRLPSLTRLVPEIGLAGGEIEIEGTGFGERTGAVSLTASTATSSFTRRLAVTSWSDRRVRAVIPLDARTGGMVLRRADGARAGLELVVVARTPRPLEPGPPPIAFLGIPDRRASVLLSQMREGQGAQVSAVRFFGERAEGMMLAPESGEERISAAGGAWSREAGRFAFVWCRALDEPMSAALVYSSTATADAELIPAVIPFGGADSIALELLEPRGGRLPALLAFSLDGRVRTTTVADLRTGTFGGFAVVNTSTRPCSSISLRRRRNPAAPDTSQLVLAYREGDEADGELVLMTGRGDGGGAQAFAELPASPRPPMRGGAVVLDVPGKGFVVAYESRLRGDTSEVRLLALGDYGTGPGIAPFADFGGRLRLEDAGLIQAREGVRVAVLASRVTGSTAELLYAEIPAARIEAGGRYGSGGLSLDLAPAEASGKLACKPSPRPECPIAWLGDGAPSLLFNRR